MKGRVIAGGALSLAALLMGGQAGAQASYAPALSVTFGPATPDTPASVTSTVTQAPGETANKTIRVHYPPQFGFNPGFAVVGCPPSAERADACPPESQIGTASAQTALGSFSGPVYFTPDFRLLIYYRGAAGLVAQRIVGYFQVTADGGVDAVVDNLPDVPATSSTITLDPGPKSPLLTPRACGRYTIVGHFTSQNEEQATSPSTVQIGPCDYPPAIDRSWLTPATLTSATKPGAPAPTAILYWDLTAPGASTTVELQRVGTSNALEVRQPLWSKMVGASQGLNSMSFAAAAGRGPLPPGDYRLALTVTDTRGVPSDSTAVTFTIAGPAPSGPCQGRRRHLPRRSRRKAGRRCSTGVRAGAPRHGPRR